MNKKLKHISEELQKNFEEKLTNIPDNKKIFPLKQKVSETIDQLKRIIFAEYYQYDTTAELTKIQPILQNLIWQSICSANRMKKKCDESLEDKAEEFSWNLLNKLPEIRALLNTDVNATFYNDPASETHFLPILCYPGILATTYYRIAHVLYKLKVPMLPRIMSELAHSQTGIDIHPGAKIDKNFFIDHGTGIVIGETTVIGNNVKIYHGVTLGAKNFPTDHEGNPLRGIKRHPNIGNNVTIYSNAVLLGPINIGDNSIIGGNVWLTEDVPNNSKIYRNK